VSAVLRLSQIVLICREADSLVEFYRRALGFVRLPSSPKRDPGFAELIGITEAWITTLCLGSQTIALAQMQPAGQDYSAAVSGWDPLFQHFAIVVSDMAAAYALLQAVPGWKPITVQGPQTLPASSGGVTAFKFRDPEGHPLELLAYPPATMPAGWAIRGRNVHLGIDHSAISVADSGRSVAFYNGLGLARVGGSLNVGPQQQKLDNIADAVVEVTAVAPPVHSTPHVELLCYRGDYPRRKLSALPNNVAATQLVFETEAGSFDALVAAHRAGIVSGPVMLPDGALCVLLRDPDGHLLRLETPPHVWRQRMAGSSLTPPGPPGIAPRWTSSAKSAVGMAASPDSRVWFTVSHGILNEIYAPRLDFACIRDFGFIVTAKDYFSEEKRDTDSTVKMVEDGVPAFRLVNTARDGRYRISKTVLSDPERRVVLQDIAFEALIGMASDYAVHAIVAPHLVNAGADNTAWCGDYKGHPALFAQGRGLALAVVSSVPWLARSAGYVGFSDGWQTLSRGEGLKPEYERAEHGNVAISGTLDLAAGEGRALLAIGFGAQPEEAALRALLSLQQDMQATLQRYCAGWRQWQASLVPLDQPSDRSGLNRYRISTAVLATHRDPASGAVIASLSIPWGSSKGDDDLGGYHLVWPRDLVQIAGGLIAAGSQDYARGVLDYLVAVQEADGHWLQNSWLDGRPYWHGVQMDETAFPILLYDMLRRAGAIQQSEAARYGTMIKAAAGYIARNGPATPQDRWEEDSGYSPFTMAVEIAALLAAADAIEGVGDAAIACYLRELADGWNERVESWTYACDTELSRKLGIDGYYIRIGREAGDDGDGADPRELVPIRNRTEANEALESDLLVSPDALALVRFGLRAADDPRILNTVVAIDAVVKRELPAGPYWYRYNDDGYGEHDDGGPFDGAGVGRLWPLLTGERAHYELAAGRHDQARRLLGTLEAAASDGGLLPEQTWDSEDIPARELYLGRPSGSAMPLAWAHAEHIKLLRSLRDGAVFDMPPQTRNRYVNNKPAPAPRCWRLTSRIKEIPFGRMLRLEVLDEARVRWSADDWATVTDSNAEPNGLGVHVCDLPTQALRTGTVVRFTLFWTKQNRWEGANFKVVIADAGV
jgi:glucoamylase